MSDNTAKKVIEIVAEFKEIPESDVKPETTLEELELDSLDALNLVFEMEEAFDVTIPDDKAFEMKTIGEMIEGIDKLIELKESGEEPGEEGGSEATSGESDAASASE